MNDNSTATVEAPSRRPWRMAIPLAVIVLLALGWTGAWFYAAHRAEGLIATWIAREAQHGRTWTCANQRISGYPFRFEVICDSPSVVFSGAGDWKATAGRAHAVAQIWNPRHVITEFQSPGSLVELSTGRQFDASWTLLQTSAVAVERGRVERASLAVENYALKENGAGLFAARHGELHVRHTPGSDATLDVAAGVLGATGPDGVGIGGASVDGELEASITAMPPFRSMSMEQRLRSWQSEGGRLKILLAKMSAGAGSAAATGDLALDDQGRALGELTIRIAGAESLLKAMAARNQLPPILGNLGSVLGMAGTPAEIDGKRASSFNVRFRDGRAFLGPLPIGRLPALW